MKVQVEKDRERDGREIAFSLIMSPFTVREMDIKLIPPALLLIPAFSKSPHSFSLPPFT